MATIVRRYDVILRTAIIALLLSSPAFADSGLDGISKDVLVDGMQTAAVCTVVDAYAITRMLDFAARSPTLGTNTVTLAQQLYHHLNLESALGNLIAQAIETQYATPEQELENDIHEYMDTTQTGLRAEYDGITQQDEFMGAYKREQQTCIAATKSFTNKVNITLPSLEKTPNTN